MSSGPVARTEFSPPGWGEADLAALLAAVDDSDYSLSDWIEALEAFSVWLEGRGEDRRPWRDMIGYIHCCTHLNAPGVALGKLNIIVNQALTEFGFLLGDDSQP